tara:strand:- start:171 stop:803 length:633 start_codon:yes stop_codon:yes gene_type:complete
LKQLTFPIISLITNSLVYKNKEKMIKNISRATNLGITMIQIREKYLSNEEKKRLSKKIKLITNNKPIIIINDDYEICKIAKLDGVHLPEKKITHIKKIKPMLNDDQFIGCSIHSIQSGILAEKLGANYLQFGSVFPTKSHPGQKPLGIKELKKITSKVKIPIIAVGGIDEKNCLIPLENGASGIASIRSLSNETTSQKIIYKLNHGEILC